MLTVMGCGTWSIDTAATHPSGKDVRTTAVLQQHQQHAVKQVVHISCFHFDDIIKAGVG
jgi:hypothetical protein